MIHNFSTLTITNRCIQNTLHRVSSVPTLELCHWFSSSPLHITLFLHFIHLIHSQINKHPICAHFIQVIWLSLMLAMKGTHFSYFHSAYTYTTNSTVLSSKVNSYLTNKKFKITEPTVSPS